MASLRNRLLGVTVLAVALLGCGSARKDGEPVSATRLESTCTRCHGGVDNDTGAPPRSVAGATDRTSISVGAHTAHVQGTGIAGAPIGCQDCHPRVDTVSSPGHMNGVVDQVFGDRARVDDAPATFDRNTGACAVYCHGATLNAGGAMTLPIWSSGARVSCSSCHGSPPPDPHPQVTGGSDACTMCHVTTVDGSGAIRPGGSHLDGKVDVRVAIGTDPGPGGGPGCARCHGNPPPPPHPQNVAVTQCSQCHPTSIDPSGAILAGGTHMNLRLDVSCTSCHGNPPPPGVAGRSPGADLHPQAQDCARCHGDNLVEGVHLNGTVEVVRTACSVCHGVPPPPPHPAATTLADCATCHPTSIVAVVDPSAAQVEFPSNETHMNGAVDFSCTTCHGNPPPSPHPQSASCAACHGSNLTNGQHRNGAVDLLASSCTQCHGVPPNTGEHDRHVNEERIACGECHPGFSSTTINAPLHLNGTPDVRLPSGTWNASRRNCTLQCHGQDHEAEDWNG